MKLIKRVPAHAAVAALILSATGCASHDSPIVGTWINKGDGVTMQLVCKPDGTFVESLNGSLNETGKTLTDVQTGTYKVGQDYIEFNYQEGPVSTLNIPFHPHTDRETVKWISADAISLTVDHTDLPLTRVKN